MFNVVCTDNRGTAYLEDDSETAMSNLLTVGKSYEVIESNFDINGGEYAIVSDDNEVGCYSTERFQLVD